MPNYVFYLLLLGGLVAGLVDNVVNSAQALTMAGAEVDNSSETI